MPDKSKWSRHEWAAYVEAGKDRLDRKRRLAETPESYQVHVKRHVETVFAIRKFNARQK